MVSLETAVARIESGLKEDPRRERVGEEEIPRDLLFTRRVVAWVKRLRENPSDALLLAAWGHDLYRWRFPREGYPKTTVGYHRWRRAQAELSSSEVEKILREEGIEEKILKDVRALILKTDFPSSPDSQILEDADCLAFLELKLSSYLEEWDEEKLMRILKGTWEKMSDEARRIATAILKQNKTLSQDLLHKIASINP
jgi:uncharacterized protein DUF4202